MYLKSQNPISLPIILEQNPISILKSLLNPHLPNIKNVDTFQLFVLFEYHLNGSKYFANQHIQRLKEDTMKEIVHTLLCTMTLCFLLSLSATRAHAHDIDGDGQEGLAEAIHALRVASGELNENSNATCNDRIDNDGDGRTDCNDTNCAEASVCATYENTNETCLDGVDNDKDGQKDCADYNCTNVPVCLFYENTTGTCSDNVDNDRDGFKDCADYDCRNTSACN